MGTYVIADPCIDVKDASCVEVCPVACIHTVEDAAQYFIDPDVCIECEQCVIVCPVDAIYTDAEVPERWRDSIERNASFFRQKKEHAGSIPNDVATAMISAVLRYGETCGATLAVVLLDAEGDVVLDALPEGTDDQTRLAALDHARSSANARGRTPGGSAIFERLELVGSLGVAGGRAEQDSLAVRAGIAVFTDLVTKS